MAEIHWTALYLMMYMYKYIGGNFFVPLGGMLCNTVLGIERYIYTCYVQVTYGLLCESWCARDVRGGTVRI